MNANQPYTPDTARKTIVIVGMRASGKSTLGSAAAKHLGWKFLDMDEVFEKKHETTCGKFIEENGWDSFREEEYDILNESLLNNPIETVISCGGGIVESSDARGLLKDHRPVVHVQRDISDIIETLEGESTQGSTEETVGTERRPNYGEGIADVWNRREPWFRAVCTHEYLVHKGDKKWKRQTANFLKLVSNLQQLPTPHALRPGATFCVLDVSAESIADGGKGGIVSLIKQNKEALKHCEGVNLRWKVGIEELGESEMTDELIAKVSAEDIALLKVISYVRNQLRQPILLSFNEDSKSSLELRLAFIQAAARFGCEYVRAEVDDIEAVSGDLSHLGFTRLLVEHHVVEPGPGEKDDGEDSTKGEQFGEAYLNNVIAVEKGFDQCALFAAGDPGHQEVAGIWVRFSGEDTSGMASLLCSEAQVLRQKLPHYIHAIGFSCNGSESLLCQTLCLDHGPVFWEPKTPWPMPAATARRALSLPSKKYFYLFGSPIQGSPSPTLHNTGFTNAGILNHSYGICDTPSIDTVKHYISLESFGGASVTIPHKTAVIPLLNSLSASAQAIDAVNTIIVKQDPSDAGKQILHGDNTDWIGIRNLLQQHESLSSTDSKVALVIGAGGTSLAACYCMKQLGFDLVVYNRTAEKAETVAKRFDGKAISKISKSKIPKVDVVVSTVPASSKFTLPDYVLKQKPVVVDVAYKPRKTELLKSAEEAGCVTHEGIEMLVEQGLEQFFLWTGVKANRTIVEEAVYKFYDETTSS